MTLLSLLVGLGQLPAQAPPPIDSVWSRPVAAIEAAAQEELRRGDTPGIAFALVHGDTILAVRGLGLADVGSQIPIRPETRFLAGSLSKAFTAVALLQLQEEGTIDVSRPVTAYLPWFKVGSPGTGITIHQLLTHTAGLPRDRSDLPSTPYTALALRDRDLGPPGRFVYSNVGYQLLSLIMEEVEGRPFADGIRQRILGPLQLTQTESAISQAGRLRVATGYQYLYDDRPPLPGEPLVPVGWFGNSAGDANIVSTAPDLARFLGTLLRQGAGAGGERLLQPASFARMVQRTVPAPQLGPDHYYGYGVVLATVEGEPVIWHSGGMPGFRAMMLGDLDEQLGVVVLMNGPGGARPLAEFAWRTLLAARRGRPLPPVPVALPLQVIPEAAQYAGLYHDSQGSVEVEAVGDSLRIRMPDRMVTLLRAGTDAFVTADSGWRLFPVRFLRREGRLIGFTHGPRHFDRGSQSTPAGRVPGGWTAYVGHYRAPVPYFSNYRVVLRGAELLLVSPEGLEDVLEPVSGSEFRVGRDGGGVERVRFSDVISGRALRMNLSGTEYYRSLEP